MQPCSLMLLFPGATQIAINNRKGIEHGSGDPKCPKIECKISYFGMFVQFSRERFNRWKKLNYGF